MIIKPNAAWHSRSLLSRLAHVLERSGLALVGATCGLFVADVVRFVDPFGSAEAAFAMIVYGAAGFYLGIDLPQLPPEYRPRLPQWRGLGNRADMVELLTAIGIFLTSVTAMASVLSIVLGEAVSSRTAGIICLSWAVGATMQIVAGVAARIRLGRAVKMAKLALFFR